MKLPVRIDLTDKVAVVTGGTGVLCSGIRCNAIAPGFFLTAQNASLLMQPDGEPTARAGKILAATPMGRFGKPEELIGALLFLVDDSCSGFVNGVVLPVDMENLGRLVQDVCYENAVRFFRRTEN